MKKIILSLFVLSSFSFANSLDYQLEEEYQENKQTRGIHTGIYQEAGCKAIKKLSNGRIICIKR
ncbi:hypothetical protein HCD05_001878 [Campylobacter jejuni]|nr:hypothetical protein [Campylobacter jejuni]EEP2584838.1 hypothetical protein [Campylobacter jejuni]EEP6855659.1 hypothetical protein [Campylobacter jejuni]EJJ7203646.1 hypothetical protein [Campylobacter jejuni]ELC5150185.1 hypothetical protein [Campylobacter jejuni]